NVVSQQRGQHDQLHTQIENLQKQITSLEEGKNDLVKEKENMAKLQQENENTQVTQLKEYVARLEKERETIKKDSVRALADAATEKDKIVAEKEKVENDLTTTLRTNQLLREDSERLNSKIRDLEASVVSEKKSLRFVQDQITQLKNDHENELNAQVMDNMEQI